MNTDTRQITLWKLAWFFSQRGANNPFPPNGAENVELTLTFLWSPLDHSVSAVLSPTLSWQGQTADSSYRVYFNGVYRGSQAGTTFSPGELLGNTVYTWRIDAVSPAGITEGTTWSFRTGAALPPFAYTPATSAVTWTDANGIQTGDLSQFNSTADLATVSALTFASGDITSISNLGSFPDLASLICESSLLTALDVTRCTRLGYLDVFGNSLAALDVSGNPLLSVLMCDNNPLGVLDVTHNQELVILSCDSTGLTTLDVSACPVLEQMYVYSNSLTTLDVSACLLLKRLDAGSNLLTSLDLGSLAVLDTVYCDGNSVTSLDVSLCKVLHTLYCNPDSLPVSKINKLLTDLVANGQTGGSVGCDSQSPPAPPSVGPPNGIAAVATLQSRGWSVQTD